jgi:mannose-6-phosphate isomerase-like protein (cupin superfamily)
MDSEDDGGGVRPALVRYPRVTLKPDTRGRRSGCETITGHLTDDPGVAWDDVAIHEWELEGEGWEDLHPHDETTYLLEGELVIESDGTSVRLRPGDAAVVRGGHLGRYLAFGYARMLAIYGPNPSGAQSSQFRSFRLDDAATT